MYLCIHLGIYGLVDVYLFTYVPVSALPCLHECACQCMLVDPTRFLAIWPSSGCALCVSLVSIADISISRLIIQTSKYNMAPAKGQQRPTT